MLEPAQTRDPEARKRRSTRISQAVPLSVTGVDALGRPFQERTSTLIVNCHGCRYQSKHYVLKNMWVTLEVPHPEAGRPARVVRARVTWIQRPRTVRELFQIGVELEIPGNFWGIAFPPPDWFPFPDSVAAESAAESSHEIPSPVSEVVVNETEPPVSEAEAASNVVQIGAAQDASLNLARQAAKLVTEAKQQIHAAARDAANKLIPKEAQHILQSVESQLNEAAAKAIQSASEQHSKHWLDRADERVQQQANAALESLRERWNKEVEQQIEHSRTLLSASVSSTEHAERQTFEASLDASVSTALDRLRQSAESAAARAEQATARLHEAREQFEASVGSARMKLEEIIAARITEADTRLQELQSRAHDLANELRYSLSLSETAWRTRMEGELASAQSQWQNHFTESAQKAAENASTRAAELSAEIVKAAHARIEQRFTELQQHADRLHSEASAALVQTREGVEQWTERGRTAAAEIEQVAARVNGLPEQVAAIEQAASQRMDQRGADLLAHLTQEFNSRVELASSGITSKLQPILEAAGAEAVAQISQQLASELNPKIELAEHTISQLSAAQIAGDDALRAHEDRLHAASDRAIHDAALAMQQHSDRIAKDAHDSAGVAIEKFLADLDTRSTDMTHQTIETLYKSAAWYEKKVQTQMQGSLDKHVEEAGEAFRAKAAELSSMFAGELDHYSRSFVELAHKQLEDIARDTTSRTERALDESAATSVNDAASRAHQAVQEELQHFTSNLHSTFDQSVAHLEAHTAQIRTRITAEARQFSDDLQRTLAQVAQAELSSSQARLDAQVNAAGESVRAARETQEHQFDETLNAKIQEAAEKCMDAFKSRLDSASNAWLLTSAASLHQQGQQLIDQLAHATDERLRAVFAQAFGMVGNSLRDRLSEAAGALTPGATLNAEPTFPHTPVTSSESEAPKTNN
jgi:hypothetical protein